MTHRADKPILAPMDEDSRTNSLRCAQDGAAAVRRAFCVPPLLTKDVRLARLGPQLEPCGPARIVQICGPSGLGKTTLLVAYACAAREAGTQVRWASLTRAHLENAFAFLTALAQALDGGAAPEDSVLSPFERIVRASGESDCPCILVIDAGGHDLGPLGVLLADLVTQSEETLHVRLIARRPSRALLGRLRSAHRVRAIEPEALLLTREEAVSYRASRRCRDEGRVENAGEGRGLATDWPLAQDLAACAEADGGSALDGQALLDQDGGLLEAAFEQGVWRELSDLCRSTLAETAVLDVVDRTLLLSWHEPGEVRALLREIGDLSPLAWVRNGADDGFSLHPLFRSFVLRKWEGVEPQRRADIYRDVLRHHAERGAPEAAMALVRKIGDQSLAHMALETFTSTELLRTSGASGLRAAMAQVSLEEGGNSAQVRISQATVAMKEGRFANARRLLESMRESLSEELAFGSPTVSRVFADYVVAQHVLAFHSHTQLSDEELAKGHFWSTYTNDRANAAFVDALRALHYLRRDELGLAREQIAISKRTYAEADAYYGLVSALLVECLIALASGRLDDVTKGLREARKLLDRHMDQETGLYAVAQCIECEVDLEEGRTEGLFERVNMALRDLEACDGWPDAFVIGYRVGACVALARNEPARGLEMLDRARRLMRGRGLVDLGRFCAILEAKVRLEGEWGCEGVSPEAWRGEVGLPAAAAVTIGVSWREADEAGLLDGWQALRAGDYAMALGVARELETRAHAAGRAVMELRAQLLGALALFEQGEAQAALDQFGQAMVQAERLGLVFLFIEYGAAILPLIEAYRQSEDYRNEGRRLHSFCSSLARMVVSKAQRSNREGIELTVRELQVLRSLALRKSNKEIAREAGLSVSAVKFHLSNIYVKLAVNKRCDAVDAARRSGISV